MSPHDRLRETWLRDQPTPDLLDDTLDRPREACGVFGIYARDRDVARTTFFALYALQHRGQESAGIATSDGQRAYIQRGLGLVTQVFNEQNLSPLEGHLGIGHTRYSTTGSPKLRNTQPYVFETLHGPLGVAHNGNVTDAPQLRRELLERGVGLTSSSDSEVITQMLAVPPAGGEPHGPDWVARIKAFMARTAGAYSLVVLTRDGVYGVRDPLGLRPLCVGALPGGGHVIASESCALGTIGATYIREVHPGEIVRISDGGLESFEGRAPKGRALCVFEYVYFARPDSALEEQSIHGVRQRLGAQLWAEAPVEADVVVGVPDSATPAAIGYAQASGIPYTEGLTKNRYIGRTFIQPDDRLRRTGVKLKYNPLRANLEGKRVVLVDDSIVRGNTVGPLVNLIREGGASEVHVRVSSPPVKHPCFMGVDMATHAELIGHRHTVEEIRAHIGADSLAYLSHEGLMSATLPLDPAQPSGRCSACFSGHYPIEIPEALTSDDQSKLAFEQIQGE
ncbi:MAG: amidophosphoribosyltransferase [Bradymonadia bacterium]